MDYLIAIDGGGTKTESVIFTADGSVAGRDVTRGINALDIGIDTAMQRVLGAVNRLLDGVGGTGKLLSLYGGLAACVDYFPGVMHRFLCGQFPHARIRLEGDGGCLIAAMQGHSDGASLIAGTGSSMYIRKDGTLQRYGGWGPVIDTEGSGYKLALHAFYSAFRSMDGRGPHTVLYDLISEQMGARPDERIPEIYAKGRPYISTFAGCVFRARRMGDRVASEIFDNGVRCLAELVEIGDRVLQTDFNVYTGGGLFSAFPEYAEALKKAVPARATVVPVDTEPIFGAAVEAMWNAGITADGTFRNTFLESYHRVVGEQELKYGKGSMSFEAIYSQEMSSPVEG